jgi:hypothetical protein
MTVTSTGTGPIRLSGACLADDAEPLLQHLLARPDADIDWRDCDAAHAAVIQVMLVAQRRLLGPPRGAVLERLVLPTLSRLI